MNDTNTASFNWADPLLLDAQLNAGERMVRDAAQVYAQGRLALRVPEAFRNEATGVAIFRQMGERGLPGATTPAEIALGVQACLRLGRMKDDGTARRDYLDHQAQLVRQGARRYCAHGARHLVNLEVVNTCEGAHDIHALVIGRAQTGIQAFC